MGSDLRPASRTDELLDFAPVLAKQADGLEKQTVLFVSPSAFRPALPIPLNVVIHRSVYRVCFKILVYSGLHLCQFHCVEGCNHLCDVIF